MARGRYSRSCSWLVVGARARARGQIKPTSGAEHVQLSEHIKRLSLHYVWWLPGNTTWLLVVTTCETRLP